MVCSAPQSAGRTRRLHSETNTSCVVCFSYNVPIFLPSPLAMAPHKKLCTAQSMFLRNSNKYHDTTSDTASSRGKRTHRFAIPPLHCAYYRSTWRKRIQNFITFAGILSTKLSFTLLSLNCARDNGARGFSLRVVVLELNHGQKLSVRLLRNSGVRQPPPHWKKCWKLMKRSTTHKKK